MIVTSLEGGQVFYRALPPRRAHQPLSGAGAAAKGGRLNRPGTHTLYLSETFSLACTEYQREKIIMPPVTVAAYSVALSRVVDLRAGYAPGRWDPIWQELACNWEDIAFQKEEEPPSWILADLAVEAGCTGILYPSQRGEGTNIAIYLDALESEDRVYVIDPEGRLPRTDDSWR